jgi:ATP-dependent exoDNAse (exonuclease V) beta subunit
LVVGTLVHKALQRWIFPGDARLARLLETSALSAGLTDADLRQQVIERAVELLIRFQESSLWGEIHSAERYTELPYLQRSGRGVIDLLYRGASGWRLLDFKTEPLPTPEALQQAVSIHRIQVNRYKRAMARALPGSLRASLVFLDANGEVVIVDV